MEKNILQLQPYSHRYPKQGAGSLSLSDRFTLIKMQKRTSTINNPPFNRYFNRKSNRALTAIQKNFKNVNNNTQISRITGTKGQSVFSRIGAVAPAERVPMWNQKPINDVGNEKKKKRTRRTRPKNTKSKFLNSKLPVIHEEYGIIPDLKREIGETKMQEEKVSAARRIAKLSPKKRRISVDANDLDKELEDYMASAPHVFPEVKDELTNIIDFDVDFMDMDIEEE